MAFDTWQQKTLIARQTLVVMQQLARIQRASDTGKSKLDTPRSRSLHFEPDQVSQFKEHVAIEALVERWVKTAAEITRESCAQCTAQIRTKSAISPYDSRLSHQSPSKFTQSSGSLLDSPRKDVVKSPPIPLLNHEYGGGEGTGLARDAHVVRLPATPSPNGPTGVEARSLVAMHLANPSCSSFRSWMDPSKETGSGTTEAVVQAPISKDEKEISTPHFAYRELEQMQLHWLTTSTTPRDHAKYAHSPRPGMLVQSPRAARRGLFEDALRYLLKFFAGK